MAPPAARGSLMKHAEGLGLGIQGSRLGSGFGFGVGAQSQGLGLGGCKALGVGFIIGFRVQGFRV